MSSLQIGTKVKKAEAGGSGCHACRGIALISILIMVVLISLLLVAFVSTTRLDRSSTFNYSESLKAQETGLTGLNQIITDLKAEISDPARSIEQTTGDISVYCPKEDRNAVPERQQSLPANRLLNLVRRSSSTEEIFPGRATFASPSSSGDASMNGRKISITRWNKPALMSATEAGSDFRAPEWVYVTRKGPKQFTAFVSAMKQGQDLANDDFVLGRYSYAIYDVGGLLDVNAAGYPNGAPSNDLARKGALAFADLDSLNPPSGNKIINADEFIHWRKPLKSGESNPAYVSRFVTELRDFGLINGFLKVSPGDNAVLSRQDLLSYTEINPTALKTEALQYLTTFSREVSAPGWFPTKDFGGAYNYKSQMSQDTARNRFLASVRVPSGASITRYKLDGTTETLVIKDDEPLIQRRFPLERLAWITSDGPSAGLSPSDSRFDAAGRAEAILQHFGLRWEGDYWIYTSPSASGAASSLKSLAEVVAESPIREPDFFELLQAAILNGSLGQRGGINTWAATDVDDGDKFLHILRLGANIIDQYDADSWPTAIRAQPAFASGADIDVFGVESLPYLYKIYTSYYRPSANVAHGGVTQNATRDYMHSWSEIELWNPHQNATGIPAGAPTALRVVAVDGAMAPRISIDGSGSNSPSKTAIGATINYANTNSWIQFTNSALFSEPKVLKGDNAALGVTTSNGNYLSTDSAGKITGVYAGNVNAPDKRITGNPAHLEWKVGGAYFPGDPLVLELQYQTPTGTWRPYSRIEGIKQNYCYANPLSTMTSIGSATLTVMAKSDPRSLRFGLSNVSNAGGIKGVTLRTAANSTGLGNQTQHYNPGVGNGATYVPGTLFVHQDDVSWTRFGRLAAMNENTDWSSSDPDSTPPGITPPAKFTYYKDYEGFARFGDGWLGTYPLAQTSAGGPAADPAARPVMLNRPFRSVGDLGYAFRDLPWKTLDMFTPRSADGGLLDLFSITDEPRIAAGKINLNTRQAPVLKALLKGAAREVNGYEAGSFTATIAEAEAETIATDLTATTAATPLINKGDLVTKLAKRTTSTAYPRYKAQREAAVRALADAGSTRTWNLMIDIIAQSGRFPPNVAPGDAKALDKFFVAGERRYWLHVAIDRITGEVVDQQLELVNE